MQRTNKIVRTKKVYKTHNGDLRYEIDMMPITLYDSKSYYRYADTTFDIYHYKWYDLRYIVDYPYYYLSNLFDIQKTNKRNLNNTKSIISRVIIFLMETIFGWSIIEIIKLIF